MSFTRLERVHMLLHGFRAKRQWWSYEVRRGSIHERTYLKKSDAIAYASVSQKVRGGTWHVTRKSKKSNKIIRKYEGVRHE